MSETADASAETTTTEATQAGTMFAPTGEPATAGTNDGAGADTTPGVDKDADQAAGGDARPEWLKSKYETVEDQAKAYNDLFASYSRKTDDLRAEVKGEAVAEYGRTIGVPDDPGDYAYPEGVNAPEGDLDTDLRTWAKENNVSPEGFQRLVNDVWMKTQPDHAAELEKLGENAPARLETVNKWITANIDEKHYGAIGRVMQTADGVAFMEGIAAKLAPNGFAPDDGKPAAGNAPKSRDEIRALQADPRFGEDEAFTAQVRAHWKSFAERQAAQR